MSNELMSLDALEIYLRSAQPRLILRGEHKGSSTVELMPCISEVDRGWDEVISEGYDPSSPLAQSIGASLAEVTSGSISVPFRRRLIKSSKVGG